MKPGKTERKERLEQLLADLSKSTSPEVHWMREMFELQYEDVKERLVDLKDDELLIAQGEARYLAKFHRQFAAALADLRRQ